VEAVIHDRALDKAEVGVLYLTSTVLARQIS